MEVFRASERDTTWMLKVGYDLARMNTIGKLSRTKVYRRISIGVKARRLATVPGWDEAVRGSHVEADM